ncbi:putative retinol dehydrogenase 13 [Penaeus vannamei]|uniref:Putative retinol dehydrogenase 13 n=1 Tax=Penaeus vannamei TaxID=6689 RepID=A0A3R7PXI8_PENVA|nr:putative retinol dehydrogenase 13 [Penaeus vannamei]
MLLLCPPNILHKPREPEVTPGHRRHDGRSVGLGICLDECRGVDDSPGGWVGDRRLIHTWFRQVQVYQETGWKNCHYHGSFSRDWQGNSAGLSRSRSAGYSRLQERREGAEGCQRDHRRYRNQQVLVRHVDTSDMSSVRKFAYSILSSENSLHILINNAGIPGYTTKKLTPEGLELAMATNHFGHFLLTNLLLDLLKASAPSRVVNVSSNSHWMCHNLDTNDLNYKWRPFPGWLPSYGQSKLSNILFTLELSRRVRGTGVTTNSVHPGVVNTEIFGKEGWRIVNLPAILAAWIMAKDEKLGAQPVIYLAVSEEVDTVSGKYFVDCKEAPSSTLAQDPILARRLWEASEKLVDLQS